MKRSMDSLVKMKREQIAWRAAQDVADGSYVNLGIGMPTLIADYVSREKEIIYHTENGLLGMGPAPEKGKEDRSLINASKAPVTVVKGGAFFDTSASFAMMRGGHLNIVFLGAFQVAVNGDLANWTTGDKSILPSVGGAMDLTVGCKDVRVLMSHVTNEGKPRLLNKCFYPLTAKNVVKKIYTDLAVIELDADGFIVKEMIDGMTEESLQSLTEADLRFAPDMSILRPPEL